MVAPLGVGFLSALVVYFPDEFVPTVWCRFALDIGSLLASVVYFVFVEDTSCKARSSRTALLYGPPQDPAQGRQALVKAHPTNSSQKHIQRA